MQQTSLIVLTKLQSLRLQKYTLHRPRLTQRLLEARYHRLTIVQASTGYGKSTALAGLVDTGHTAVWYRLDNEDADPQRFLAHLIVGFMEALPDISTVPLTMLEAWTANRAGGSWTAVIDTLINEFTQTLTPSTPCFLILDDAHHLDQTSVPIRILDRLIGLAPDNLHIILGTRTPILLPTLLTWRVKGEVLEIGQEELAFKPVEIDALFRHQYGHALTLEQAMLLVEKVEGWPIALHLVWKNLQKDGGVTFAEAIAQLSGSTSDLFAYLTQEVLTQQPADIQDFLRLTAVLRQLTTAICDDVRQSDDSQEILTYLIENGLFVIDLGGGQMRYHYLFRELLSQQLAAPLRQAAHQRAAIYYKTQHNDTEAIYHWLAAGAYAETAVYLQQLGREMIRNGRLDTLSHWIGLLPTDILAINPALLAYLGDIARLHSQFETALNWYQQAEQRSRTLGDVVCLGQALRGQARIYLDTVNPNQAERLLQQALRLSDRQDDRESRARLNELLAENLLNQGRLDEAKQYQAQAHDLRHEGPGQAELPVRILLRTGRLAEARQLLEAQAEKERREPVLRPRAHRETLLLLSLILAYQGEQEMAMQTAVEGTERGQALGSEFVTAVGLMRQGHAWLLLKNETGYQQATRCFQEAIQISEALDVPRLKVEASWGLCQAFGFRADLQTAVQVAAEGIEIARAAGDEWIEASIRTTLGASYVLAAQYTEAQDWLASAQTAFRNCGDTYGEAISHLWQCLLWQQSGDTVRLERDLSLLWPMCQKPQYDALFLRPTLLGPPETRLLVPLLLSSDHPFAQEQLTQLGLAGLAHHPGYQLRVQSLGPLQLWHGQNEIPYGAWKRKKALQLFLLLLTHRQRLLHREEICELLWPEQEPNDAIRDFKIAYSAMCIVLEPKRKRNAPSAYVVRKNAHYGLRPEADLWLDADEFERLIALGDGENGRQAIPYYQQALDLYHGDYLQAYRYDDWCQDEQQRLLLLYLRTAEKLAHHLIVQQDWETVIPICEAILTRDDCWEEAYRLLITAFAHTGNRPQMIRTYEKCTAVLQQKLGIKPGAVTTATYQKMMACYYL